LKNQKQEQSNPNCPYCKKEHTVKFGFNTLVTKGKCQRFKCQDCGHTFYSDGEKDES